MTVKALEQRNESRDKGLANRGERERGPDSANVGHTERARESTRWLARSSNIHSTTSSAPTTSSTSTGQERRWTIDAAELPTEAVAYRAKKEELIDHLLRLSDLSGPGSNAPGIGGSKIDGANAAALSTTRLGDLCLRPKEAEALYQLCFEKSENRIIHRFICRFGGSNCLCFTNTGSPTHALILLHDQKGNPDDFSQVAVSYLEKLRVAASGAADDANYHSNDAICILPFGPYDEGCLSTKGNLSEQGQLGISSRTKMIVIDTVDSALNNHRNHTNHNVSPQLWNPQKASSARHQSESYPNGGAAFSKPKTPFRKMGSYHAGNELSANLLRKRFSWWQNTARGTGFDSDANSSQKGEGDDVGRRHLDAYLQNFSVPDTMPEIAQSILYLLSDVFFQLRLTSNDVFLGGFGHGSMVVAHLLQANLIKDWIAGAFLLSGTLLTSTLKGGGSPGVRPSRGRPDGEGPEPPEGGGSGERVAMGRDSPSQTHEGRSNSERPLQTLVPPLLKGGHSVLGMEALTLPVFISHGFRDPVVPFALGKHMKRHLESTKLYNVTFEPFLGGHDLTVNAASRLFDWIDEYLGRSKLEISAHETPGSRRPRGRLWNKVKEKLRQDRTLIGKRSPSMLSTRDATETEGRRKSFSAFTGRTSTHTHTQTHTHTHGEQTPRERSSYRHRSRSVRRLSRLGSRSNRAGGDASGSSTARHWFGTRDKTRGQEERGSGSTANARTSKTISDTGIVLAPSHDPTHVPREFAQCSTIVHIQITCLFCNIVMLLEQYDAQTAQDPRGKDLDFYPQAAAPATHRGLEFDSHIRERGDNHRGATHRGPTHRGANHTDLVHRDMAHREGNVGESDRGRRSRRASIPARIRQGRKEANKSEASILKLPPLGMERRTSVLTECSLEEQLDWSSLNRRISRQWDDIFSGDL